MPNGTLIILEAIALVVLGQVAHIVSAKITARGEIIDNLILAIVVGVAIFSLLGEPSATTAIPYLAAGYAGGEILDWLFKPWWNKPEESAASATPAKR